MGAIDRLKGTLSRAARSVPLIRWYSPTVTHIGRQPVGAGLLGYDYSTIAPAAMFRTQPHLRTVVTFFGRNVAQLGLHVYERQDDGGRKRSHMDKLSLTMAYGDGADMTPFDLFFATIGDLKLYDVAFWWFTKDNDSPTGITWRRLPPNWVTPDPDKVRALRVDGYLVSLNGEVVKVPASRNGSTGIVRIGGYDPNTSTTGSPAVEALRDTLQEQIEASKYREQIWKRGGRVSTVLERPADAEPWSDSAREAFREDWYAKYTGRGPKAGGTPILEDGMKLTRIDFNAKEQQFVEAARLSMQTVAAVYHVNPTMLGYSDGASYGTVKEYSRMLYTDTLGPDLVKLAQVVNMRVLPIMGMEPGRWYAEHNIDAKMAGSFEEQSASLSSAAGGPWMTRNEARAIRNLPAVEGGDELIVPMNVTEGGQASPLDSGSQNVRPGAADRATSAPRGELRQKSPRKRDKASEETAKVLLKFFTRQGDALRGAKKGPTWDAKRWDRELTDDLLPVALAQATAAGKAALADNGDDPELYNEARTFKYLNEATYRNAVTINEGTKAALDDALDDDDEDGPDPYALVFKDHAEGRANVWGAAVAGFVVGFGATEAARQAGGGRATKTWRTTSSNSRSSHAAMDGETVGIDEQFSNGLDWPGSFGDPDEVAGCQCEVAVSW